MITYSRILTYIRALGDFGVRSEATDIVRKSLPKIAYVRWEEETDEDGERFTREQPRFNSGFARIYLDEESAYKDSVEYLTELARRINRDETDTPWPKRAKILKIRVEPWQMRAEKEDGKQDPFYPLKTQRKPGRFIRVRTDQVISYRDMVYFCQGGDRVVFKGLGDVHPVGPQ